MPPYGIVLVADKLGALFAFMVTTIMIGGLLYTFRCHDKCMTYPAFIPLFLLMEVGLVGAMLTGDLFTLFVFMELMVLASVSLTAISDDQYGLEAALKYILISSMGTLFFLLGIASLYATFGTLNMAQIAQILLTGERPILAASSSLMLLCAFLLKSAVFPFHFWQPDFHTTAPTPISAMLSSIVVKVGVYGILRLVTLLFVKDAHIMEPWLSTLGIIGILFGSLGALRTYNAKRMLAYSTFAQIGFHSGRHRLGRDAGANRRDRLCLQPCLYQVFAADADGRDRQLHQDLRPPTLPTSAASAGECRRTLGWLVLLGGLSLAGVPPFNGFISKLTLIQGGVESGDWTNLIIMVGAGILTLMYMIRAWQRIFQQSALPTTVETKDEGDSLFAPLLLIVVCLLLGTIFTEPLIQLVSATVQEIQDPSVYISAVFPDGLGQ